MVGPSIYPITVRPLVSTGARWFVWFPLGQLDAECGRIIGRKWELITRHKLVGWDLSREETVHVLSVIAANNQYGVTVDYEPELCAP